MLPSILARRRVAAPRPRLLSRADARGECRCQRDRRIGRVPSTTKGP